MHRPGLSRPPRQVGRPAGAVAVSGQVVHDDAARTPLHHTRVELFVAHGGREELRSRGMTDAAGRFEVRVDVPAHQTGSTLRVRVLARRPRLDGHEPLERTWIVVARAMSEPWRGDPRVDLGRIVAPWWERRPGPLPRLAAHPEIGDETHPVTDWPVPSDLSTAGRPVEVPAARGLESILRWADLPGAVAAPGAGWRVDVPDLVPAGVEPRSLSIALDPHGAVSSIAWREDEVTVVVRPDDPEWAEAEEVAAVLLRRAILLVGLGANAGLWMEREALAAHRHLRAHPLATMLLPALRGAAWVTADAERHAFTTHDDAWTLWPAPRPAVLSTLARAAVAAGGWPQGSRWPGHPLPPLRAAVREALMAAVTRLRQDEANAWRAGRIELERWWEEREADRDGRALTGPAVAVPGVGGAGLDDEASVAAVDVLELAAVGSAWWRCAVAACLSGADAGLHLVRVEGRWQAEESPSSRATREALASRVAPRSGARPDDPTVGASPLLVAAWARAGLAWDAAGLPAGAFRGRVIV